MSTQLLAIVIGFAVQLVGLVAVWVRVGYWAGRIESEVRNQGKRLSEHADRLEWLEHRRPA